jgi:hypothetical protein
MLPLLHINRFRDRHGQQRYYYRPPGGKNMPLVGEPGSLEFLASYRAAEEAVARSKPPIGADRNSSGSVAQAASLYLGSARFGRLAPDTRRTRKNELERFREAKGTFPLALMERRHVERWLRDRSPVSQRNALKALGPFLDWCVAEGLLPANPTTAIQRPISTNKEGYRTWPDAFVEQYRKHHPIGTKARAAFEVLINTGAARVDAALLGRQHIQNGMLCFRRHKTGVLVEIPILPELHAVIDTAAGRLTLIATEAGAGYTKEAFGNQFRHWCDEAGIPKGYSAHGVRKYAAKVRAELGATAHQLMAWFGWLTMREAERYTRDAERRRATVRLGEMVNAANRIGDII